MEKEEEQELDHNGKRGASNRKSGKHLSNRGLHMLTPNLVSNSLTNVEDAMEFEPTW